MYDIDEGNEADTEDNDLITPPVDISNNLQKPTQVNSNLQKLTEVNSNLLKMTEVNSNLQKTDTTNEKETTAVTSNNANAGRHSCSPRHTQFKCRCQALNSMAKRLKTLLQQTASTPSIYPAAPNSLLKRTLNLTPPNSGFITKPFIDRVALSPQVTMHSGSRQLNA